MNKKRIFNRKNTHKYQSEIDFYTFSNKTVVPSLSADKINDKEKRVDYGEDNLFPNHLLNYYTNSPTHGAIINGKSTYIIGDGLKFKNQTDDDLIEVNSKDTFNGFVLKCVLDFVISNGFAVEVIFNALNQPIEFHHVPFQKIRTNTNKNKFWYRESWEGGSANEIIYDRYYPQYNSDNKSKIFYFDGYFPSLSNTYSTPDYIQAFLSIATEIEIQKFNNSQINNGFTLSNLLTFYNGDSLLEEVKTKVKRKIEQNYTGSTGKKLMIQFQDSEGKEPTVNNIGAGNDWADVYLEVKKSIKDDILIGHGVTSPLLFGIKTEGQLGGTTELEIAYSIYKTTYILSKRNELEAAFNLLFFASDIPTSLSFVDKDLFASQLSDSIKEKIYTINEMRAENNLKPLPNGDRLLSEDVNTSLNFSSTENEDTSAEIEQERILTEDDFIDLFKKYPDLGTNKDEFEIVEEDKFSFAAGDEYLVMYDYVLRDKYQDSKVIISTSRAFCRKVIALDKYFSMQDIQAMSSHFGYDIFKFCGGFSRKKGTTISEPKCRHEWKTVRLKKK